MLLSSAGDQSYKSTLNTHQWQAGAQTQLLAKTLQGKAPRIILFQ